MRQVIRDPNLPTPVARMTLEVTFEDFPSTEDLKQWVNDLAESHGATVVKATLHLLKETEVDLT